VLDADETMAEYKARRRHVPAFGEWNYYYSPSSASPDEPAAPELSRYGGAARAPESEWWCSPEPEACSDVWFRYSPPPRKPPAAAAPKKARRTTARPHFGAGAGKGSVASVREQRGGAGAAAAVAAAARAPGKGGCRSVVRPVDEDLYQVPPPDDFVSSGRRPRQVRAARKLFSSRLVVVPSRLP
jgi:hypothetical protein